MSDGKAEILGLASFRNQADATSVAIENGARHVALTTAQRVMAGIRARVRFRTGQHLRDRVAIEEESANRQFRVGFKDGGPGHPLVPVWNEFGTKHMPANPAVHDAVYAERAGYEAQMRAVVSRELTEASK